MAIALVAVGAALAGILGATWVSKLRSRLTHLRDQEGLLPLEDVEGARKAGQASKGKMKLGQRMGAKLRRFFSALGRPFRWLWSRPRRVPWYLVVGEDGSGKSALVGSAAIEVPLRDHPHTALRVQASDDGDAAEAEGRQRWWLGRKATLLEVPAEVLASVDRDALRGWLKNMKRRGARAELQGVVWAVSVDELLDKDEESQRQQALRYRWLLKALAKPLGPMLPVYVVVTKTDRIPGLDDLLATVPKVSKGQPLGLVLDPVKRISRRPSQTEPFRDQVKQWLSNLHGLSWRALGSADSTPRRQQALRCHFVTQRLDEKLRAFLGQLFKEDGSETAPWLRGLFFAGVQASGDVARLDASHWGIEGGLAVQGQSALKGAMPPPIPGSIVRTAPPVPTPPVSGGRQQRRQQGQALFEEVIFQDVGLATLVRRRAQPARRRRRRLHGSLAVTAGVVGAVFVATWQNNLSLVRDTRAAVAEVRTASSTKLSLDDDGAELLDRTRQNLKTLSGWMNEGAPFRLGLGMFQGSELALPLGEAYMGALGALLLHPVQADLERTVAKSAAQKSLLGVDRNGLEAAETYLLLGAGSLSAPLKSSLVDRLWAMWSSRGRTPSTVAPERLRSHFASLVDAVSAEEIAVTAIDPAATKRARDLWMRAVADGSAIPLLLQRLCGNAMAMQGGHLGPEDAQLLAQVPVISSCFSRQGFLTHIQPVFAAPTASERSQAYGKELGGFGLNLVDPQLLRRGYLRAAESAWNQFFRTFRLRRAQNTDDLVRLLDALVGAEGLYARIFSEMDGLLNLATAEPRTKAATAKEGTGGEEGAKSTPADKRPSLPLASKELVAVQNLLRARDDDPPPIARFTQQLDKIRAAMSAALKGGSWETVAGELEMGRAVVAELVSDPRLGIWRDTLSELLADPLRQAQTRFAEEIARAWNQWWSQDIASAYESRVHGRYPFDPRGEDANLEEVTAFLGEQGVLFSEVDRVWGKSLVRRPNGFSVVSAYQGVFGDAVLSCLGQANSWNRALFPQGEKGPQVDLDLSPFPVASKVSEVEVEIGGMRKIYRNGPKEEWRVEWPGPRESVSTGARITLRGHGAVLGTMEFPGQWGLFRMLDAGRVVSASKLGSVMEWNISPGLSVKMGVRFSRASEFFRRRPAFSCPERIS